MNKIIIVSFLFFSNFVFSQEEASNWYFGGGTGIKFLPDGSLIPLSSSAMTAQFGCATLSDANGNVILYSNGERIWNRNNQIMSNGSDLSGSMYATPRSPKCSLKDKLSYNTDCCAKSPNFVPIPIGN